MGKSGVSDISGVSVSCPRCGSPAIVEDGIYAWVDDVADGLRLTTISREAFEKIADAFQKFQNPEQFSQAVADISPQLSNAIQAVNQNVSDPKERSNWLQRFFWIAVILNAMDGVEAIDDFKIDGNFRDAYEWAVDYLERQQ